MTDNTKPIIEESANYDNYMDDETRKNDSYSISLDKFFDEPMADKLVDATRVKKVVQNDVWKSIYVHFRTQDDMVDFCTKINQMIPGYVKETYYPLEDRAVSLFKDMEEEPVAIDANLLVPEYNGPGFSKVKSVESEYESNWKKHWVGMPEYTQEDKIKFRAITLNFRSEADYKEFSQKIAQDVTEKTKSIWHPEQFITKNMLLRWIQPEGRTLPEHPMYIVSKGRSDSMFTSRSLSRMQIPHYIVIEPQDLDSYDKALDVFKMRDYVTLLVAPFSNHGDGPGRARNWAWDHSISIGATSHWVLDDNISDFYRLHNNERIRFESGVGFQVMEDFVARYDNVYILVHNIDSLLTRIKNILLTLPTPVYILLFLFGMIVSIDGVVGITKTLISVSE